MASHNPRRVLKDRRTKNLTKRLRPGDIALIHHADLDTTAARALADARVSGVVNASPSITGRYPNRGPAVLLEAGVPLLDDIGEEAFQSIQDGKSGVIEGNTLRISGGACFEGKLMTPERNEALLEASRANISTELDRFARNTLEYLKNEQSLLCDPIISPKLQTKFAEQHVLIVVRGDGYKADLAMLQNYMRDARPVILAVDGGADALLETRIKPDVILGDMDSVSDATLRCGAELIVHGYADGRGAPGQERIQKLGLKSIVFESPGTSEDVAMLLADELGAKLIVAVGTHFSLVDFLDKGRGGMASTFLTRLRIGSKLVDAKGIARLWSQQHLRIGEVLLLLFAASTPIIAVLYLSPMGQVVLQTIAAWFRSLRFR